MVKAGAEAPAFCRLLSVFSWKNVHTGGSASPAHFRPSVNAVAVLHGHKSIAMPGDVVLAEVEAVFALLFVQFDISLLFYILLQE